MFMQVIKGACVAFCAACVASCGLPCIYSIVARSGGFPGAFGAFRGYGPRVLLSAFCATFKGAAGPPVYIPVAAVAVYPRRVLGPFAGL